MNYLITGGARGIGRHLSRSLLLGGNRVFLLDADEAELGNTMEMLSVAVAAAAGRGEGWGGEGKEVGRGGEGKEVGRGGEGKEKEFGSALCDLRDREQIREVVGRVGEFFGGRLDVLINNAMALPHTWSGSKQISDASATVEEEWDAKLAVGLTAPFLLSRLCLPLLSRDNTHPASSSSPSPSNPGTIINISSTRAHQSEPDSEAYATAKAGLLGLTHALAISLGPRHGIRVNAILPGWIHVLDECAEGDGRGREWEEGLTDEDARWHPVGRVGRAEDVARAVGFLVESGFVTGAEIVVDGGVGRKMVYPE
ncbi:hypothetical protein LTR50_006010 [Elasticomyces elasticus]|nr:hypothetical protein LTR50_006010 [Elasticomyces elasticus]